MSSISQLLTEKPLQANILKIAGEIGQDENIPVYVVGGYVRDALLNKNNKDIDIVVEGNALFFAKKLAQLLNIQYTIDFDKGRIVATMAIHRDFNWKKIAHSVIKKGK